MMVLTVHFGKVDTMPIYHKFKTAVGLCGMF